MLTREDQTVVDCIDVVYEIASHGLGHIGFKDVGVEPSVLRDLNAAIRERGAISYLEVVSATEEQALASARTAVEIGVDRLLGGTWVEPTLEILSGSSVEYYPFPGRPTGHPTELGGTPEQVAEDCRRFDELGCAGVDVLAYRATEAPPLDLVRAARAACNGRVIVAGSVSTPNQVRELAAAGADAFTIGSAVFAGAIEPRAALLHSQLRAVAGMLAPA